MNELYRHVLTAIHPAMCDPAFDPTQVILLLELPELGTQDCRAVGLETAIQVVEELQQQVKRMRCVSDWRESIERYRAEGLVACIRLISTARDAEVQVFAVKATPTAKA